MARNFCGSGPWLADESVAAALSLDGGFMATFDALAPLRTVTCLRESLPGLSRVLGRAASRLWTFVWLLVLKAELACEGLRDDCRVGWTEVADVCWNDGGFSEG